MNYSIKVPKYQKWPWWQPSWNSTNCSLSNQNMLQLGNLTKTQKHYIYPCNQSINQWKQTPIPLSQTIINWMFLEVHLDLSKKKYRLSLLLIILRKMVSRWQKARVRIDIIALIHGWLWEIGLPLCVTHIWPLSIEPIGLITYNSGKWWCISCLVISSHSLTSCWGNFIRQLIVFAFNHEIKRILHPFKKLTHITRQKRRGWESSLYKFLQILRTYAATFQAIFHRSCWQMIRWWDSLFQRHLMHNGGY